MFFTYKEKIQSVLMFGTHENKNTLHKFKPNILYYKQCVDNIFAIWLGSPDNVWEDFKSTLI
jgi:hypothetical protein